MDRNKQIALLAVAAVVLFLAGFVPQWMRANQYRDALEAARWELQVSRQQDRLGAALTESLRSNYERSRQLMTEFFTTLQQTLPRERDPARQRELQAILAQRDEVITLLARAAPEASQRLMLIHTSHYRATHPEGGRVPATTPTGAAPPAD